IFTTLIYGQGWKIIANINQLERQLIGAEDGQPSLKIQHKIFYFGDLDYEGITIWYKLNQIRPIHLATIFYKELLKQKESKTSKNQKKQEAALQKFLHFFPEEKERISALFDRGRYYPQEAITERELKRLFIQLGGMDIGGVSND
ncbi:MAG: hypothetical protein GX962_07065, partial [Epulopiscium sp.]|nr:hypothetical protein [Candidatus Epulonipiscium sp.]